MKTTPKARFKFPKVTPFRETYVKYLEKNGIQVLSKAMLLSFHY